MLTFLRTYYAWILVPFLVTLAAIGTVLYLAARTAPDDAAMGFNYSMF
jgi:hypothetical protein